MGSDNAPSIAERLAAFAAGLSGAAVPDSAREAARMLILDGIGIALAASTYPFARATADGLRLFGAGDTPVIGLSDRLALRDAALLNGVLIHGLDFDDTHLVGVVHVTSSCFPVALAAALRTGRPGRDLVTAYVLAVEVAARLGAVAKGELNQVGFHPTGVLAAFGCAVGAGWLLGLDARQLTMAQGIALSMAAGSREYSADAAWTKRLHPGWAAFCGLTAAGLAQQGFTGPRRAYEGGFGLFATHLGLQGGAPDLPAATAGLGTVWEVERVAVKPFPACQLSIACIDAAIALSRQQSFDADAVDDVEAVVVPHAVAIVCEPAARRLKPDSPYAAQFSLPFCVATGLLRSRFGLAETERIDDAEVLRLAGKVRYRVDHGTNYPRHFPGEVTVTMKDGRRFTHREAVNLGAAENPVPPDGIRDKFRQNATVAVDAARAEEILALVEGLDALDDVHVLAEAMSMGDAA